MDTEREDEREWESMGIRFLPDMSFIAFVGQDLVRSACMRCDV